MPSVPPINANQKLQEVERKEGRVNSSKKKKWLTKREEERPQEKQELPTVTLDSYFIKNKIAES